VKILTEPFKGRCSLISFTSFSAGLARVFDGKDDVARGSFTANNGPVLMAPSFYASLLPFH